MTAYFGTLLGCETCAAEWFARALSVDEARASAVLYHGWSRVDASDRCAACTRAGRGDAS